MDFVPSESILSLKLAALRKAKGVAPRDFCAPPDEEAEREETLKQQAPLIYLYHKAQYLPLSGVFLVTLSRALLCSMFYISTTEI